MEEKERNKVQILIDCQKIKSVNEKIIMRNDAMSSMT